MEDLIKKLKESIIENLHGFQRKQLPVIKTDEQALKNHFGEVTYGLAHYTGIPTSKLRYKLKKLEKQGKVIRDNPKSGGSIMWWPVGFLPELKKRFEIIQEDKK